MQKIVLFKDQIQDLVSKNRYQVEENKKFLSRCIDGGSTEVQVFVYHQSLVDQRHRQLRKLLVEKKAVKLLEGCDAEYLYQALSEMAENHLMETAKRLAKQLPIYEVKFDEDESFIINQL